MEFDDLKVVENEEVNISTDSISEVKYIHKTSKLANIFILDPRIFHRMYEIFTTMES